ncbi:MAG: hypothetical protein MMC23_003482 [Stictis urceolatum]|nr:hypothetical protein [Stictis urceolata]
MASTDSGSVDGTSSVGDAWEEIGSACSENETSNNLSRQLTPMSEHPESSEYGVSSIMSNNTSQSHDDDRAPATPDSHDEVNVNSQEDTNMFTPTAATLNSASWSNTDKIACGFDEDIPPSRSSYIKCDEIDLPVDPANGRSRNLGFHELLSFKKKDVQRFFQDRQLGYPDPPLYGYLQMCMSNDRLIVDSPFDILYVGPKEMRSTLIEKIGAALTARNGETPSKVEIDSSRVTVVPVSDFHNDESPEVVLIDSVGVDIEITECRRAWFDERKCPWMSLTNGSKALLSLERTPFWGAHYQPHLAIVYIPDLESEEAKSTRLAATELCRRMEFPFLTVSANVVLGTPFTTKVYTDLLHISVEGYGNNKELSDFRSVAKIPIDLATFLSLDAGQLNRNLAYSMKKSTCRRESDTAGIGRVLLNLASASQARCGESVAQFKRDVHEFRDNFPKSLKTLWFSWIAQIRGRPVYYTATLMVLLFLQIVAWIIQPSIMIRSSDISPKTFETLNTVMANIRVSETPANHVDQLTPGPTPKCTSELLIRDFTSVADFVQASMSKTTERKDHFRANVLGDSHVILIREEESTFPVRNTPKVYFAVQRYEKQLVHDVQRVSDGVYVIELPVEDAYGKVNITLWTKSNPRLNETSEVDFGTPWLKISAWLNSAQAMTKQARKDIISARSSIFGAVEAVKKTNSDLLNRFSTALPSVSPAVNDTRTPGSGREDPVKELVSKTQAFMQNFIKHASENVRGFSARIAALSVADSMALGKLRGMLDNGTHFYNDQTAKISKKALDAYSELPVLRIGEVGYAVQEFRSRNFRPFEKKILKAWWRVNGAPRKRMHLSEGNNKRGSLK